MIKIAIVEDEEKTAITIQTFISKFMEEKGLNFQLEWFSSAESFLFCERSKFDLVCMDIQLPNMDGMSAVRELRKTDSFVMVIFVTSLAQYAINGYEVNAFDFMLKPVSYYNFALKLTRAVNAMKQNLDDNLVIRSKTQKTFLKISEIYYVEITSHTAVYHTDRGNFSVSGTMKKICETLKAFSFSMCSQSCVVNLRYVKQVFGNDVIVAGERLAISRLRRKEFMHELNGYLATHVKRGEN